MHLRVSRRPATTTRSDRQEDRRHYSSINGNGFGGYGETVLGTEGHADPGARAGGDAVQGARPPPPRSPWPRASRAGRRSTPPRAAAAKPRPSARRPSNRGRPAAATPKSWNIGPGASAIRIPQNLPRCHPEVALGDAVIALTTNIAIRENRRIEFKPEWFDDRQRRNARRHQTGRLPLVVSGAQRLPQAAGRKSPGVKRRGRRPLGSHCKCGQIFAVPRRSSRNSPENPSWKNGRSAYSPASTPAWASSSKWPTSWACRRFSSTRRPGRRARRPRPGSSWHAWATCESASPPCLAVSKGKATPTSPPPRGPWAWCRRRPAPRARRK